MANILCTCQLANQVTSLMHEICGLSHPQGVDKSPHDHGVGI